MVAIIGLVIMGALVWLIAWSMAGESEAEKRRILMSRQNDRFAETLMSQTQIRHAAHSPYQQVLSCVGERRYDHSSECYGEHP